MPEPDQRRCLALLALSALAAGCVATAADSVFDEPECPEGYEQFVGPCNGEADCVEGWSGKRTTSCRKPRPSPCFMLDTCGADEFQVEACSPSSTTCRTKSTCAGTISCEKSCPGACGSGERLVFSESDCHAGPDGGDGGDAGLDGGDAGLDGGDAGPDDPAAEDAGLDGGARCRAVTACGRSVWCTDL